MEENKYQEAYYDLKSSLKGEKYLGQEVAKLDLGDTMLVKSQTEDGKLCWIVENKKENIKPDYIEAFENIIFQKRDNGYISDAYRNDIDVVYEALNKLEKLKNEEIELINNNKNKSNKGENNMKRLTNKKSLENYNQMIEKFKDYIPSNDELIYNKLGKLEDIEEELGCPLDVLMKALINGKIFVSSCFDFTDVYIEISYYYDRRADFENMCFTNDFTDDWYFKDYKKTWWLKEDKSE